MVAVGVTHLFLHFRRLGEHLGTDTPGTQLTRPCERIAQFRLAKSREQHLRLLQCLLREKVQLGQHIVDTVRTKTDTHARHARHAEYPRQVVVSAATGDTAHLHIQRLDLEDGTRVVVQSPGKGQVQLDIQLHSGSLAQTEDGGGFFYTFPSLFTSTQHLPKGRQLVFVIARHAKDGLQLADGVLRQTPLTQLIVHFVRTNLVQFVNRHGDVHYLVRRAYHLGYSAEDLAVVQLQAYADTQAAVHLLHNLYQLQFAHQAVRSYHVHVALVELAVAPFLRTVGTPYRLDLVAAERKTDVVAVLRHEPRKRHGQVVPQTFLAHFACQRTQRAVLQLFAINSAAPIAGIQYLKQQFVALLTVLAHQCGQVLKSRGLYLAKTVQAEHRTDGVENIIASSHLCRPEVASSFRNGWFGYL